jgi:signal transduction histidine kinase
MNLFFKIFLPTFLVLALPGIPIIFGGYFIINEIVYELHKKSFMNEIVHIQLDIDEAQSTLEEAGVADIEFYSINSKEKILDLVTKYRYGKTGHIYIMDSKGYLLAHKNYAKDNLIDISFINKMLNSEKIHGDIEYKLKGKEYFSMFEKSPTWEWLIVFEIEKDEIFQKRNEYVKFSATVIIIMFFIVVIISYFLTRNNIIKMNYVLDFLKNIENGNLNAKMPNISQKYKIGIIQHGIRSMIRKMINTNSSLKHEIEQRKIAEIAMIKAKEEAENANLAKSRFIANMSHELRTPINAIIGYGEILGEDLQDGIDYLDPKQSYNDTLKITNSAKYLLSLVNDVLDISKLEADKIELFIEKFYLEELLKDIEGIIQPIIEKKNNKLELKIINNLDKIETDITKLRQIILNLLSNAAKFSENNIIILRAERINKNNQEHINIQVIDNGIGMTSLQLSKIFQPFIQADLSTTRKYGGTGLGLTISKKFAKIMQGDITVDSDYGKGSVFTLELPIKS